jgi:hypothetical protein
MYVQYVVIDALLSLCLLALAQKTREKKTNKIGNEPYLQSFSFIKSSAQVTNKISKIWQIK